jgi:hypothetical protein
MVVALYKQAAPAACRLAAWADRAAGPEDRLWWHGGTSTVWADNRTSPARHGGRAAGSGGGRAAGAGPPA